MQERRPDLTQIHKFKIAAEHLYAGESPFVTMDDLPGIKKKIRENNIKPQGILALGMSLARKRIVELENEFGVLAKDPRAMRVAILPIDVFKSVCFELFNMEGEEKSGFYTPSISQLILAESSSFPDYYVVAEAYHEFIHKFMEMHVQVHARVKDGKTAKVENTHVDRRSGLDVEIIKNKDGQRYGDKHGDLLNELGNYLEQGRFMAMILANPAFKQEASSRRERLYKTGIMPIGHYDIEVGTGNGAMYPVRLYVKTIHFDKNNELIFLDSTLIMQLAEYLAWTVDPEGSGEGFRKALLAAKVDPSKQNILRNLIDSKLGKGFYTKIKTAKYGNIDDILNLLVTVQAKIHPDY